MFLNLSQFYWLKFGKILKNRPIHIPSFAFYKGSFIYQEFLLPMLAAVHRVFCIEYRVPPRTVWCTFFVQTCCFSLIGVACIVIVFMIHLDVIHSFINFDYFLSLFKLVVFSCTFFSFFSLDLSFFLILISWMIICFCFNHVLMTHD